MALVTPIINSIPALDATKANTITFIANGGEPIVKNEIKILTNDSNETVVYNNIETTTAKGQIIPANTLTNGVYYKVVFRTYDASDNTSEWSNYQPFYCYSMPTLTFNISDEQIIHDSYFDAILTYNQAENERLDYVYITFYDINNKIISYSDRLFNNNTPPVAFNYYLGNLENNKGYKIKAEGATVEGTLIETELITFYVSYETIDTEGKVYPEVDSCEGCIRAISSPIVRAYRGYYTYHPSLSYIDSDTKLDLTSVVGTVDLENDYSHWVKWYDLYPVSNFFLFRLWFYPARVAFKIADIVSTDGTNTISLYYQRGTIQDYISVRTTNGVQVDRGLGGVCNGNTRVFLWLQVKGDKWNLQAEILSNRDTILDWNGGSNNINYNVTTDIPYGSESYGLFVPEADTTYVLDDVFDTVIVGNGIFDEMILSLDANMPYTTEMPSEDISSILFVKFNGSVANEAPLDHDYNKIVLQRKDDTMTSWWTMKVMEISTSQAFAQLEYDDYFLPSGVKQSYALTIYENDVPSKTYTVDVVPKWGRVFLTDKYENYKLNYAVIYSNGSQNIQNGVLMPIGSKYPIVIQNAEGNYKSGSLQFKVLGYKYETDKILDRNSIVKQKNDILAFLTNGRAKCIKDFNGNIVICKVVNSPQVSYDANWGNGIVTISFDWVEQTQYNDYEGMTELGLIDAIDGDTTYYFYGNDAVGI